MVMMMTKKEWKGGEKGVQRRRRPHFIRLPPVHLLHTDEQQSPVKSGDRKDFQRQNSIHPLRTEIPKIAKRTTAINREERR